MALSMNFSISSSAPTVTLRPSLIFGSSGQKRTSIRSDFRCAKKSAAASADDMPRFTGRTNMKFEELGTKFQPIFQKLLDAGARRDHAGNLARIITAVPERRNASRLCEAVDVVAVAHAV